MWWFKKKDRWQIKTGSAGFVRLYKNGERVQPKDFTLSFRAPNTKDQEGPTNQ